MRKIIIVFISMVLVSCPRSMKSIYGGVSWQKTDTYFLIRIKTLKKPTSNDYYVGKTRIWSDKLYFNFIATKPFINHDNNYLYLLYLTGDIKDNDPYNVNGDYNIVGDIKDNGPYNIIVELSGESYILFTDEYLKKYSITSDSFDIFIPPEI